MARMFILLSDISIKKGDMLQARATLQSLKDNYPVDSDGVLDEVKAKLDSINAGQEAQENAAKINQDSATVKRK
jgi:hypothetical protein